MKKVLLIDDETDFLDMAEAALDGEFTVLKSSDAVNAVGLYRTLRPDAVFLDVMMPGADGRKVLERLASEEDTCGIPVVVVTAMHPGRRTTEAIRANPNVHSVLDKLSAIAEYRRAAAAAAG